MGSYDEHRKPTMTNLTSCVVLTTSLWHELVILIYFCGNYCGSRHPWSVFGTRQECLDCFLQLARDHFSGTLQGSCPTTGQHAAQEEMQQLLDGGLFGFLEPDSMNEEATDDE